MPTMCYTYRVNRAGCVIIKGPRRSYTLLRPATCEQFLNAWERLDDQGAPPPAYTALCLEYINNREW